MSSFPITKDTGLQPKKMSLSSQRSLYSWKPEEVLNMVNPMKHSETKWTCPSLTSKKTRCLNSRDAKSYIGARLILSEMSTSDPSTFLDNKDKLIELAKLTICLRSHLNGFKQIPGRKEKISCVDLAVAEWVALINNYVHEKNERREKLLHKAVIVNGGSSSTLGDYRTQAISAENAKGIMSVPVKLESIDDLRRPQQSPTRNQSSRAPGTADVSPRDRAASEQRPVAIDLQAFTDLALEKNRLEAENSQLRKEYKAMQQRLARSERDRKAVEKDRDDLLDQIDELYDEINALNGESEDERVDLGTAYMN